MGHQTEVEQLGVRGPVVVLLFLHPRVLGVGDGGVAGELGHDEIGHLGTEKDSVNWLNTRNSPGSAGCSSASSTQARVSRMFSIPRV